MLESQQTLPFRPHGGARVGAGRKPSKPGRSFVPHRRRPKHRHSHPVHVTLRARGGLPGFRERGIHAEVQEAIRAASESPSVGDAFRVVQFSLQGNHVHLIVEARDTDALSRGLRGLTIRVARAVNRALAVRGPVWADRYHARALTTPRAVRNALVYVLMNARKHGEQLRSGIDALSSAPWFDGFAQRIDAPADVPCPVKPARTWLANVGWRRRGLVRFDERPRAPG